MRLIVVDIGGTSIKSAVCEEGLLGKKQETDTQAARGGDFVVSELIRIIHSLGEADGIGVSTAGQVDVVSGTIRYANENIPGYTGTRLKEILEREFEVPVVIENDVNAAALGEAHYGAAKGIADFLCLTYGTGVGGAIIQGGEVWRGISGSAGEFGSMITHGECVTAGRRISGCYEEAASTAALVRNVSRRFPHLTSGRQIFERLELPGVREEVDAWLEEIVHGLVTIIHIFNPGCIVLGGGVMGQAYVAESVKERVYRRIMPSFAEVRIMPAELGNAAGLWGVAYLIQKRLSDARA
ncbi:ROK family protein [Roseburia hominis]